jgi:hypothetical protein
LRKFIAALAILAFIGLWILIIGTIGSRMTELPDWVQLVFYVVAGVGWILPLKPVLAWMNRPRSS